MCVVMLKNEVKRWSGGGKELAVVPGRMGWHLGRVLKVGISGPAQRRQKCLPIDAALEEGKGKTHAMWPERLRQIFERYVYTSGES